jgi:hypothetical protein
MLIDIRLPLGGLFLIYGILLSIYGAFSDPREYTRSLGININFWWGLFMLIVGAILLSLAGIRKAASQPGRIY